MTVEALKALKIIEIQNAASVYLGTDSQSRGEVIKCNLNEVERPRELDDYHLSGVYTKAGVPFEVEEIRLDKSDHTQDIPQHQKLTKMVSDSVYAGLHAGKRVLVVGGTCLHAPGVAGGMRRALGREAKIGIIWMDAHGDLNTPATSPSGMLGGMPFATVLGLCMDDWRAVCGLEPPIDDHLAILTDARNLDKEEVDNLKRMNLTIINTEAFLNEQRWAEQVKKLADKVDAIYLHIDADIADGRYLPGHHTPEENGPGIWPLLRNIRTVVKTGKVPIITLASIYFSPEGENAGIMRDGAILTGIRIIGSTLGEWEN